jgi:hypothetical protein
VSDLLDKAHADAFLGLLHAALDPVPIAVYDGKVPDPLPDVQASPCVVVYFAANALDGKAVTYVTRGYCHCVAGSMAAVRAVTGQVRAALLNVRPTVAGRSAGLIKWYDGQPANPDETLGHLAVNKVDVYELITTP